MAESRRREHLSAERADAFLDDLPASHETRFEWLRRYLSRIGIAQEITTRIVDRELNRAAEAESVMLVAYETLNS